MKSFISQKIPYREWKGKLQGGRIYLQYIYLGKDLNADCKKNYTSIRQSNMAKDRNFTKEDI